VWQGRRGVGGRGAWRRTAGPRARGWGPHQQLFDELLVVPQSRVDALPLPLPPAVQGAVELGRLGEPLALQVPAGGVGRAAVRHPPRGRGRRGRCARRRERRGGGPSEGGTVRVGGSPQPGGVTVLHLPVAGSGTPCGRGRGCNELLKLDSSRPASRARVLLTVEPERGRDVGEPKTESAVAVSGVVYGSCGGFRRDLESGFRVAVTLGVGLKPHGGRARRPSPSSPPTPKAPPEHGGRGRGVRRGRTGNARLVPLRGLRLPEKLLEPHAYPPTGPLSRGRESEVPPAPRPLDHSSASRPLGPPF